MTTRPKFGQIKNDDDDVYGDYDDAMIVKCLTTSPPTRTASCLSRKLRVGAERNDRPTWWAK